MIIKEFDLEDTFTISAIINKMEIEADVERITNTIQTQKLENKKDAAGLGKEIAIGIGIDVVTKMLRNLYKARTEVKQLISDLTGKTAEEVGKMGIKDIKQFFTELVNKEGFGDFLSPAGEIERE